MEIKKSHRPTFQSASSSFQGDLESFFTRFYDGIWSKFDRNEITTLISPDLNGHLVSDAPGVLARGINEFAELVSMWHDGFSEISERNLHHILGEEDLIVFFCFSGRHTGPFLGIPASFKASKMNGVDFFKFQNDLVLEWRCFEDLDRLKSHLLSKDDE